MSRIIGSTDPTRVAVPLWARATVAGLGVLGLATGVTACAGGNTSGGRAPITASAPSSPAVPSTEASSSESAPTTETSPTVTATLAAGLVVNKNVMLDNSNFCTWSFGTNPMPLASTKPVEVRIDDRCNDPAQEDPAKDHPTGVYSTPDQIHANVVAKVPDGGEVTVLNYMYGEGISDATGDYSTLWLRVKTADGVVGDMPDVNVGGGYSLTQLESLGIQPFQQ